MASPAPSRPAGSRSAHGRTLRLSLVALVVVGNLASLPLVLAGTGIFREPNVPEASLGTRGPTGDVLDLAGRLDNVERTHNLFLELQERAEGASLQVLGPTTRLDPGDRLRARLVGLLRPATLDLDPDAPVELATAVRDAATRTGDPAAADTLWELSSQQEEGKPGIAWRLWLADDAPDELVMVVTRGEDQATWDVVDVDLLPGSLRERVRRW